MLALLGRFETYPVGRNIEWEKVKEIYQLGLKHGMRLAAISGVNGSAKPMRWHRAQHRVSSAGCDPDLTGDLRPPEAVLPDPLPQGSIGVASDFASLPVTAVYNSWALSAKSRGSRWPSGIRSWSTPNPTCTRPL